MKRSARWGIPTPLSLQETRPARYRAIHRRYGFAAADGLKGYTGIQAALLWYKARCLPGRNGCSGNRKCPNKGRKQIHVTIYVKEAFSRRGRPPDKIEVDEDLNCLSPRYFPSTIPL